MNNSEAIRVDLNADGGARAAWTYSNSCLLWFTLVYKTKSSVSTALLLFQRSWGSRRANVTQPTEPDLSPPRKGWLQRPATSAAIWQMLTLSHVLFLFHVDVSIIDVFHRMHQLYIH